MTSGIFKIYIDGNHDFQYIGASSQVEVVFKDYMNWIKANNKKAPIAVQKKAEELVSEGMNLENAAKKFQYEIIQECSRGELTELRKAIKEEFND